MSDAKLNTDRELWREGEDGDRIFVTLDGGIGINCGGNVWVMPIGRWHKLAHEQVARSPAPDEAALRELCANLRGQQKLSTYIEWGHQAADAIDKLQLALTSAHRERDEMRERLQPFAKAAALWDGEPDYEPLILKRADMHPMAEVTCTVGDLRRALSPPTATEKKS